MYKILIIVIPIIIICCLINIENKRFDNNEGYYIHSPFFNKSFFIKEYNTNKISDIQLSLNKRNNIYKIIHENNKYFLKYKNDKINELNSC